MSDTILHYEKTGSGPLLMLLHPVGLDGSFWPGLIERCAADHTVVAVDLRGHGQSPPALRPGRMDRHVADIATLIEHLAMGSAIVLGVSFGGMIAQNVALARPDLVSGLILAGCPGRMPEAARSAIVQRGADAETGGMQAVVETTMQRWFTPDFIGTKAAEAVKQRLLSDSVSGWAAAWEAVSEHDVLDRLTSFGGAALVIAGEKDAATTVEAKRALAAALPNSRLEILAGAPHIMQIEAATAFADSVCGFLAEKDVLQ